MDIRLIIIFFTLKKITGINSDMKLFKIGIPAEELEIASKISSDILKSSLRYGFHRTHECQSYSKAYVCIQKCVDLQYEIAYSNKNCSCFCITKKEKAQYTPKQLYTKTKWKLGAPSTTKPAWAVKLENATAKNTTSNKLMDTITVEDKHTTAVIKNYLEKNDNSTNISVGNATDSIQNESTPSMSSTVTLNIFDVNANLKQNETTPFDNSNNSSIAVDGNTTITKVSETTSPRNSTDSSHIADGNITSSKQKITSVRYNVNSTTGEEQPQNTTSNDETPPLHL